MVIAFPLNLMTSRQKDTKTRMTVVPIIDSSLAGSGRNEASSFPNVIEGTMLLVLTALTKWAMAEAAVAMTWNATQ